MLQYVTIKGLRHQFVPVSSTAPACLCLWADLHRSSWSLQISSWSLQIFRSLQIFYPAKEIGVHPCRETHWNTITWAMGWWMLVSQRISCHLLEKCAFGAEASERKSRPRSARRSSSKRTWRTAQEWPLDAIGPFMAITLQLMICHD
jgi:hypothetical protein